MAAVLPQPPAMAYSRRHEYGLNFPYDPHTASYQQHMGQSPFSPAESPVMSLPSYTKNPSFESPILGKALSDASFPSNPSSPSRSSYGAGIQQTMRNSCHSNRSSNSHRSKMVSPLPLNPTRDVEKQEKRSSRIAPSSRTKSRYATTSQAPERDASEEVVLETKALKILIYLSVANVFMSFMIVFYMTLALITILVLQPIRLCTKRTTLRQQIIDFLSPTLKIQLAFVYSTASPQNYNTPLLILVQLLAPAVSFGVAFAAWVAGAFWFFNAILGDPAGSDRPRGYNDGRASVIGVRRWWERWLTRALR